MPIQRPDLDAAKKILFDAYKQSKIPFEPKDIEPYCAGGGALTLKCVSKDNIEYAIRFPNTENKLNDMLAEMQKLTFFKSENLSKNSGLDIPETHHVPHETFPFVWHKAVVGETLIPSQYAQLTEPQRVNLAKKIAVFLSVIHTCKKSEQIPASKTNIAFILGQMRLNEFAEIKNKLPESIFNKYNHAQINTNYPDVVCHFDMHGRNMALNPDTKELVGIFDFGDTCVQKCFLDFYKLSFISRNLTRRVINEYNKISDVKINIEDVDIAYLCDVSNKLKNSPNDGICNMSLQNFVKDINEQNMQILNSQKEQD